MLTITIELNLSDRDAAKRLVEQAGFTVTKVTTKRATRASSAHEEADNVRQLTRADAHTDMPHGLDTEAQRAYVRGYAKGCLTYTRKHGAPSITGATATGTVDKVELRRLTRAHEWDRQPTAHRAGMRELNAFLSRHPAPVSLAS